MLGVNVVPDRIEWLEWIGKGSKFPRRMEIDEIILRGKGKLIWLPARMRGRLGPEEWKPMILSQLILVWRTHE